MGWTTTRTQLIKWSPLILLLGLLVAIPAIVLADGGDFSLDFTAAEPTSYDHSTGGGAFDDRTINVDVVESLEGGDFVCEDTVTYLTQIVVDAGASGAQSIELDYSFTADTTGQSGAAFDDVVAAVINYGVVANGDGPGGTDDGMNDDLGSTAAIVSESLTGPLFQSGSDLLATVSVDDLEPGEEVIVRVDVTIACDPGSSPKGNLQAALLAARVTDPEVDTISVGNQTINLKNANQIIQLNPSIDIQKTPDNQTVRVGDDVTFTLTVTNNGDADLNNVVITDALCDTLLQTDNGDGDSTLGVGEVWIYECTVNAVVADFTNSATVTADDPDGRPVEDTDTADVDVIDPSIDIEKTPDNQTVVAGGNATFEIVVTNTGDVALFNVTVTDPVAPDCDVVIGNLFPGDSVTYTCMLLSVAEDLTNVATVTGFDEQQNPVEDEDDADVDVIDPSIALEKSPDDQLVASGSDVTFTITATNTGDVDLDNLALSDDQCDSLVQTGSGNGNAVMEPGESWTWECTVTNVTAAFTNVATITADDPLDGEVGDEDDATVDVAAPGIDIHKTPDLQTIISGDSVTFDIAATNVGDVDLSSVQISDDLCDTLTPTGTGNGNAVMEPGETWTWECTVNNVTEAFTNVATVTAVDPFQTPVGDSDDADVEVLEPSISITKSALTPVIEEGEAAVFEIVVTNDGEVDLFSVTVDDPIAPDCDASIGDLAVGASVSYTCVLPGLTEDTTNIAYVGGFDALQNPVGDNDSASVIVIQYE